MRVEGIKTATTLSNFHFLLDSLIILGRVTYQVKTVSRAKIIHVLCLMFELSAVN